MPGNAKFKEYGRICHKCEEFYKTKCKWSRICAKCYTENWKTRFIKSNVEKEKNNEEINLRLLEVVCPSTQRHYVLRVATECDTVHKARQWTFGQSVRWWEKNTPERGVVFKEEA